MGKPTNVSTGSSQQNDIEALPYLAPPEALPAKLPTTVEIKSSQDIFVEQPGRKVVGVGPHFVVKFGLQINLEEGRTMLHVRRQSKVPLPIVYALFHDPSSSQNYIIMERIQGSSLQDMWASLSSLEQEAITLTIQRYLNELRSLPSPAGYCSVGNKPLRDGLFWSQQELTEGGPFETEEDLNNAIVQKYESSPALRGKAEFYKRHLPSFLHSHSPTFTHGDLQRKNILVRESSVDIVFIDWEMSGWYPDYWEYVHANFACGFFEDNWHCCVDRFLEPFFPESILFNTWMLELR